MSSENDLTLIKELCVSLIKNGAFVRLNIARDLVYYGELRVGIEVKNKTYLFSDPDWLVVIKQLKTLLGVLQNEKNTKNETPPRANSLTPSNPASLFGWRKNS